MNKKTDILLLIFVAILTAGCNLIDDPEVANDEPVDVSLSFTVSNANLKKTTRQSNLVVQEGDVRDVEILRIIPFDVERKIISGDRPKFAVIGGTETKYDKTSSKYFYYENCSFSRGVTSFLVYGKAEPATGGDAVNGALDATFADQSPSNITFSLKQIRNTKDIHSDATDIANYLTTIARTSGWTTTSDSRLKAYYLNFIGQGSESTSLIAGSSKNVEKYVAHLKALLEAEPQSTLRDSIIKNINKAYPTNYPAGIDLPDGAAALRWEIPAGKTEYAFVPQTVTTTEAVINGLTRFVYPAELYYYGNSKIYTSTKDNRKSYYDKASWGTSNTDENTVLSGFEIYPGIVTPEIKAAAIEEPLQYAVARLDAKIKASSTTLVDAKGNDVTVGSTSFPLTAVLVGGQYPVGFDFTPLPHSETEERIIYDNNVKTNTGDTYFYLSTTAQGPVHTLLLQSADGEDVKFVLEFQNDSDKDFTGVDGIVYRGTKFYLVGEFKLADATGDVKDRVFTQDQKTTATLTVNGLAKAYNIMPNLLSPQLEIGVTLTTTWTGSTPTTVILE